MAVRFCDTQLVTGANNGTTMDDAYRDLQTALTACSGLDTLWVRRRSERTTSFTMGVVGSGTLPGFRIIGWPRAEKASLTGDFVQGSRIVKNLSFSYVLGQYNGRKFTLDSIDYMIEMPVIKLTLYDMINSDVRYQLGEIAASYPGADGDGGFLRIYERNLLGAEGADPIRAEITGPTQRPATEHWPVDDWVGTQGYPWGDAYVESWDGIVGMCLDKPYTGPTGNRTFTLQADEDYAEAQLIDDSGWTINKAVWNADSDDLPHINFGAIGHSVSWTGRLSTMANFRITRTDYLSGSAFYISGLNYRTRLVNIINVEEGKAMQWFRVNSLNCQLYMKRCNLFSPIYIEAVHTTFWEDVCLNMVSYGARPSNFAAITHMRNCNIGTTDYTFMPGVEGYLEGHEVGCPDLGLGIPAVQFHEDNLVGWFSGDSGGVLDCRIRITNWQRKENAVFQQESATEAWNVPAGSGNPNQRTGGSDQLLYMIHRTNGGNRKYYPYNVHFEYIFEVSAVYSAIRLYVNSPDEALDATELFMEVEYVQDKAGDAINRRTKRSDEAIAQAIDVDDWSQYLEIADVIPVDGTKIHIRLHSKLQDEDKRIYIDPLPEMVEA